MAGRRPLNDRLDRWLDGAVEAVSRGTWSEENVWALLGEEEFSPGRAWEDARTCFLTLLERLAAVEAPLVVRLVVHLRPVAGLDVTLPGLTGLDEQMDRTYPPNLFVSAPLFRPAYSTFERYEHPIEDWSLVDDAGQEVAKPMFVLLRSAEEREEGAPYRRQLLFEHVSSPR